MDYYNLKRAELYTYIYNRECKYHEYIKYHSNGCRCEWTLDTRFHNTRGPAVISISGKNVYQKRYYKFGLAHNSNGPAYTFYFIDGLKSFESYYINGKLHNSNGPAEISYYTNGKKQLERYYDNGVEQYNN